MSGWPVPLGRETIMKIESARQNSLKIAALCAVTFAADSRQRGDCPSSNKRQWHACMCMLLLCYAWQWKNNRRPVQRQPAIAVRLRDRRGNDVQCLRSYNRRLATGPNGSLQQRLLPFYCYYQAPGDKSGRRPFAGSSDPIERLRVNWSSSRRLRG